MSVRSAALTRGGETSMVVARLRVQMGYAFTLWPAPEIVKDQGRNYGVGCSRRCVMLTP